MWKTIYSRFENFKRKKKWKPNPAVHVLPEVASISCHLSFSFFFTLLVDNFRHNNKVRQQKIVDPKSERSNVFYMHILFHASCPRAASVSHAQKEKKIFWFCVTDIGICTNSRLPMFIQSNGSMDSKFRCLLFGSPSSQKLFRLQKSQHFLWLICKFNSKKMAYAYAAHDHFFKSD